MSDKSEQDLFANLDAERIKELREKFQELEKELKASDRLEDAKALADETVGLFEDTNLQKLDQLVENDEIEQALDELGVSREKIEDIQRRATDIVDDLDNPSDIFSSDD